MNVAIAGGIVVLFAMCGWAGAALADVLCSGRLPHFDGPSPVRFERWHLILAAACVGLVVGLRTPSVQQLVIGTIAVVALSGCAAADFTCGMLPDVLTLGPTLVVFGFAFAAHNWLPVVGAAFVLVPFAFAALFSRGRGMGWGDVKLATFGGALLGARDATLALSVAAVLAYFITRRFGLRGKPIAFGPYLAGSIAATFAALGIH